MKRARVIFSSTPARESRRTCFASHCTLCTSPTARVDAHRDELQRDVHARATIRAHHKSDTAHFLPWLRSATQMSLRWGAPRTHRATNRPALLWLERAFVAPGPSLFFAFFSAQFLAYDFVLDTPTPHAILREHESILDRTGCIRHHTSSHRTRGWALLRGTCFRNARHTIQHRFRTRALPISSEE